MKVDFFLSIGLGSGQEETVEIDDKDIEGLSQEEVQEFLDDEIKCWAYNYIEYGWSESEK